MSGTWSGRPLYMVDPHEETRQRYVGAIQGFAAACGERLTWEPQRRSQARDEMLRAVLGHAAMSSPWHRDRLLGIDIDQITSDDLSALPTMSKTDLMENWDAIVTESSVSLDAAHEVLDAHAAGEPFRFLNDRFLVVATGGSTGVRSVLVGDERWYGSTLGSDFAMTQAQAAAGVAPALEPGQLIKMARLNATSPVHVTATIPAILGGRSGTEFHIIGPGTPISDGIAVLNRVQPHLLVGYPSLLEMYADAARAGRLSISPVGVGSIAEPLTAEVKAAAESVWGVAVSNVYASSEGFVAKSWGGSPQLYQPDDVVIMELVDDENRPVDSDAESTKVLVTHLHNYVQPFVRYEISDRVRWAEPANGCPWRGQWLSPPQGRTDDIFRYGPNDTVAVHPHVFRSALLADPAILSYQVHQTTNGADIHVVPAADATIDTAALSQRVTDDLQRAGLKDPVVEVATVTSLEHHAQSGKLRRFVPLTNHP
jgi:phenylacetate-CoA ligase